MSRPRIDSLKIGQEVTLEVHRSSSNEGYSMRAVFGGIMGIGNSRQANFDGFSLYRYNGYWAISSDARRVTVVNVRNPRPEITQTDDLMDVFSGTGNPVDSQSGTRPSPLTVEVMHRQRGRAHQRNSY